MSVFGRWARVPRAEETVVAVVGGDRLVRDALAAALGATAQFRAVGAAELRQDRGEIDAVAVGGLRLDLTMEARLRSLQASHPSVRVVAHVAEALPARRRELRGAGVVILPQTVELHQLCSALQGQPLADSVAWTDPVALAATGRLSGRELEVLALLADGHNPEAVARMLSISAHTARDHVKSIRTKMDSTSTLGAVMVAAREGLVPDLQPQRTRAQRGHEVS